MTPSDPSSAAAIPRPGDIVGGKYVLERLLGQGGMGAVFAARHLKLSKAVAIKIMLAESANPEAIARFIGEGRNAANIQNENVVRVDDVDEEMGYAYMVLELCEGEDLGELLEKQPGKRLLPHVGVGYVLDALKGVMAAHAIGIVHRDLKPSNLFLTKRKDGSTVVKVLDFGISKAQGSSALAASPSALTTTKAMLGSPLYMSPEQLRSSRSVDSRADIWAMGIILYEFLTGTLPFGGETLGELFAAILETEAPPLSQRVQGLPPGLEAIVLRCLQRRPDQRFQSISDLSLALAPYANPVPGYAMPVQSVPMLAASGPTAGSTSRPMTGPAPGTMAIGAITPPGMQQSGSGWQNTNSVAGFKPPKTSLVPIVVVLIVGLIAAFAFSLLYFKRKPTEPVAAAALESTTPSAVVSDVAPAISSAPTPPPPTAKTEPDAPAATTAAPPKAAVVAKPTPRPVVASKVEPTPKPTAAPEAAPKPKPSATSTGGGGMQNTR